MKMAKKLVAVLLAGVLALSVLTAVPVVQGR